MKPLLIATAVSSVAVGFVVGYKVAEKRLVAQFEERLEKETAGMREFYQVAKKPFATPQEAVAELIKEESETAAEANNRVAYHKITQKYKPEEELVAIDAEVFSAEATSEVQHHNVFVDGAPVLISQEEFMENETAYVQGALTYYSVDEVLVDERDDVIEDKDASVGVKNLMMFGNPRNGSSDPNIIHIRNPRLQMEFEVCQSESSYRREVLGMDEDPPQLPSGRKRS
jgi:hypothetical protein